MLEDSHIALAEIPEPVAEVIPPAEFLRHEIYEQLGQAAVNELALEHSWMKLGSLLLRFKNERAWVALGYDSFPSFLIELRDKFRRGKTQLWSYYSVAESLGPLYDDKTLEEIGISKALEIKRALKKNNGKQIPDEIIDAAKKQETTAKELRAMIGQTFNLAVDDKGIWFDFEGTYFTPEQKQEFIEAVRITKAILKLDNSIPEHIQRREIFLAWAREFTGTHGVEVYGPQQPQNTPATLMLPKASE